MTDPRAQAALLARLSRARAGAGGAGLVGVCRDIAEGLKLSQVVLRLTDDGPPSPLPAHSRWPAEFHWPPLRPGLTARRGLRELPVRLADEEVGLLAVDPGSSGALRRLGGKLPALLTDVVQVLGPVLHLARLEQELETALVSARAHTERIAAARRQAFAERDQERRDLERDLHDGAQHHLVALQMTIGLLELQLTSGDLAAAAATLERLRLGIEQTEQTLLSTAAGNCPPVLLERGLIAALIAEFRDAPGQVRILAPPERGRRFPLQVETAAYFTCLEAVNNARKHALGAQVTVQVEAGADGLAFAVSDTGPGLDRHDPVDSFGLSNMRARVEALSGTLELRSAPGAGTTIDGFIPDLARWPG